MAVIDIRNRTEVKVTRIIFSDEQSGGLAKAFALKDDYHTQVGVVNPNGVHLHIKYDDVDNFIAALKKAKELWHKP